MALREYHAELLSSQDRAIELARAGAEPGARVVVGCQQGGRGRHGRRWDSPVGGLYLSVVLGPSPSAPSLLPLSVALHLAESLEARYALAPRIKWPNDLVVAAPGAPARKLGGILIDTVADPTGRGVAVVGVGLNAQKPAGGWDPSLENRPVALSELTSETVRLEELERLVADAVGRAGSALEARLGARSVVRRARPRLFGVGAAVSVDGRLAGTLRDLGEDGAVWVDGEDGPFEVRAGEVRIVEELA